MCGRAGGGPRPPVSGEQPLGPSRPSPLELGPRGALTTTTRPGSCTQSIWGPLLTGCPKFPIPDLPAARAGGAPTLPAGSPPPPQLPRQAIVCGSLPFTLQGLTASSSLQTYSGTPDALTFPPSLCPAGTVTLPSLCPVPPPSRPCAPAGQSPDPTAQNTDSPRWAGMRSPSRLQGLGACAVVPKEWRWCPAWGA